MALATHERGGTALPFAHSGRAWWLAAGLLIAAFLARGPLYLSVFPPFEGWDEYQHLAFIVHLDETGAVPLAHEASRVSVAMRPLLLAVPHPVAGAEQLREWGVLSYAEYWNAPARRAGTIGPVATSPRLYQAQHPPLAYVLALPIWRAMKTSHPLEAIYAIRTMNLLLVGAALALFAAALTRLVPAFAPRVALFALVCLHPLFFQNLARVANDALAVATGIAGFSLLMLADGRTLLSRGLLAAVCIAASVWSKQTSLTLIPALVLGPLFIGRALGVSAGRLWRVTIAVGMVFLVLVAPLWLRNYQQYGALLTTQDSLELAARGSVMPALATSLVNLDWRAVVDTFIVPGRPWVGGWSFVGMHETVAAVHGWYWGVVLAAAALGVVIAAIRFRTDPGDAGRLALCAAVVIFTALGMLYHLVLSNAVFGRPMTNPWYFMTALPFLFVLLVRGLETIHRRLATAAAAGLATLFVIMDVHGTWIQMPKFYASTTDPALQWSRLTEIHPVMLAGGLRWEFLALQLGALCLAAGALIYARRQHA
jgi:hypothetical protein